MSTQAVNLEHLRGTRLPEAQQQLTPRDCILYALGLGIGMNPLDDADLQFVDETRLKVVPSIANVLANDGHWIRELDPGLDWRQAVHGEQSMELFASLPATAAVTATGTILDVVDKGEGKGAVLYVERELRDADSGQLYAKVMQTVFCRANGGYGGKSQVKPVNWELPQRPADLRLSMPTSPQQALIYRLSGDDHPLHIRPETARAAGFPRPILHGMATFGLVGHGLGKLFCGSDPTRIKGMSGRFSAPVFPGDTIVVEAWNIDDGLARFVAKAEPDQRVVLTHGVFRFEAP